MVCFEDTEPACLPLAKWFAALYNLQVTDGSRVTVSTVSDVLRSSAENTIRRHFAGFPNITAVLSA